MLRLRPRRSGRCYGDIGWIAGGLVELFVLLALIQAVIRGRIRTVFESLTGVAAWGIFWIAGMTLAVVIFVGD